jgi:hypothetical protein
MSDYLTRLVERSLGLAPQVKPLIASINAPSDQMLREKVEPSVAFESSPAVEIEASQLDTPGVAVDATDVETHTRTGDPLPRGSRPPSESQAEFPIEKRVNRIQPAELRPGVSSQSTSSVPRPEAMDITAATTPDPPSLPRTTPIVAQGMAQSVVQPEIIEPLEPAASPMESRGKNQPVIRPEIVKPQAVDPGEAAAPPEKSPSLPRPTPTASKKATQPVIQPEIISPPKQATSPLLPTPESSSATEPSLLPNGTTTASNRTAHPVVQPEIISPLKPPAFPLLPARPPSPNEPPAIHVTIGRVEVRAIMPQPATPKAASPATPKLSLKEYLRQRRSA